jgi:hypothetical protein
MAQYEQLNLFDLAPYIVSQVAVDRIKLAILKDEAHDEFHHQLELEFPSEDNDEFGDDFRLAA